MINRDFSEPLTSRSNKKRYHLPITAITVIAGVIAFFSLFSVQESAEAHTDSEAVLNALVNVAPLSIPDISNESLQNNIDINNVKRAWKTVSIKSGDTLTHIFEKFNIPYNTLRKIVNADKKAGKHLNNLQPGKKLSFHIEDNQLQEMRYHLSSNKTVHYSKNSKQFNVSVTEKEIETRINHVTATINESLFGSGLNAGMTENLIMELVGIFGWDIDFALDLRKGDHFNIIYEQYYHDGNYLRDGNILAATFTNQGNEHTAIMFRDDDGRRNYFTPEGKSLKKAFLRSPVDFRRISSRFQKERYHPVFGKKRPHRGVDYAAKTGTPIKASGDGKIIYKGTKGGYGRTIIIQHGHRYETLYAHMSGYKRGMKAGKKVRQGDVIGYVGKSGVATGPHLHYEFRVNGRHKNPLKVKFPDSSPIEKRYRNAFNKQAEHLIALLDLMPTIQLASIQ